MRLFSLNVDTNDKTEGRRRKEKTPMYINNKKEYKNKTTQERDPKLIFSPVHKNDENSPRRKEEESFCF